MVCTTVKNVESSRNTTTVVLAPGKPAGLDSSQIAERILALIGVWGLYITFPRY